MFVGCQSFIYDGVDLNLSINLWYDFNVYLICYKYFTFQLKLLYLLA